MYESQTYPIRSTTVEYAEFDDRMLQIFLVDSDAMLRIYPAASQQRGEGARYRAFTQPESVAAELRKLPDNGQVRIFYSGSPEFLFFIGEAVLGGVVGNAAYDALKVTISACNAKLRRLGDGGYQRLSEEDAIRVARTLVRAWCETDSRIRTVDSALDSNDRWVVVLKVDDVLETVTIPPGPLVGARIHVASRDGRSVLQRIRERIVWRLSRPFRRRFRS